MSTILKTLKKLEEEKSVLDQKLNLKEMVLKEDTIHPSMSENGRHIFFLMATMITGVLTLGGTLIYYWGTSSEVSVQSKQTLTKTPKKQTPLPKKLSRPRTFEGVPMDGILSDEKELIADSEQPSTFFKQLATKIPGSETQIMPPTLSKKETLPTKVSSNFEKAEKLIQFTATLEKSSSNALTNIQNGYVPGIKIKGIIFFDKGSSSNHVIATTPSNSNIKLRVGDSVKNAILKSIQPNSVIFLYQDQLIKMSIGQ